MGRRSLLAGAGAAALTVGMAAPAGAAPATSSSGDGAAGASGPYRAHPDGSPVPGTIASAPISGYIYRTVCMYDFKPFDPAAGLTWGGRGTYSTGVATMIRATIEIPAGALIRDVEYYVYNATGFSVNPQIYLYVPGQGYINTLGSLVAVPSTSSISATRDVISADINGPYPIGSRLLVGISTPTDGTVQVNGARVGFGHGAATSGLLDGPVRAYDSRNGHGRIPGGTTRTITLPSSIVVPGTAGILANITAVNGAGVGYLKIYSAAAPAPASSSINYVAGAAIANAATIAVSAAGQIKIFASASVDVIIDVTGVIS